MMSRSNYSILRNQTAVRTILAQFITQASQEIDHAFHFTVRGHNELSFGTFCMLSEEQYACMLLSAGLVEVTMSQKVYQKTSEWSSWIEDHDLDKHGLGLAEISISHVLVDAFKHRKPGSRRIQSTKDKKENVLTIRIGAFRDGEATKASL